ncbi:translesion DNA synthesis-associated protein ImuA [Paraburkholderia sprentiae]|uniref:translesion DNA synthesis-associated protein ImuA n=1 Tax=Paraburkholderia sprentiae TaxID=948107 RepID=UPI000B29A4A3|nr:translesion DNA synthesis-associated protein ImuA [Paraburkholderia sprentiae]
MNSPPEPLPESIHPSLWRASQLARGRLSTVDTGYPALSRELPGGGWPVGALTEVLPQATGSGELRVLAPALSALKKPIVLVAPPCEPSGQGLAYSGIPVAQVLLLRAKSMSDQLWATEQTLKAGMCGAVLLCQTHARTDALRRLLLASRSSASLFFVFRPLQETCDASPAELRISLRTAERGVRVDIVKRKGPRFEGELTVELNPEQRC